MINLKLFMLTLTKKKKKKLAEKKLEEKKLEEKTANCQKWHLALILQNSFQDNMSWVVQLFLIAIRLQSVVAIIEQFRKPAKQCNNFNKVLQPIY